MKALFRACLLLAIAAAPVYAQTAADQGADAMNCPMMANGDMQKQMGAMMTDMRALMEGTSDPASKARMQTMHEHMSAMMANMQKMRGGMMRAPAPGAEKSPEQPGATPPADGKEEHARHHPVE